MKFSLAQQIEEVNRELDLRRGVYARKIAAGEMRQSIADYHMGRMEATKRTLEWLQENEAVIREDVRAKRP